MAFRSRISTYEAQESTRDIYSISGRACPERAVETEGLQGQIVSGLQEIEREREQHQHVVSRLAERAEKAEVEAAQLQAEVDSLKGLASARAVIGEPSLARHAPAVNFTTQIL